MYQPGERNDEEDAKSDEDMDLLRGGCIDQVRVGIRLERDQGDGPVHEIQEAFA